jgi:hypothetical protein
MAEHKVSAVLLLTHHATKPLPVFFRVATLYIFFVFTQKPQTIYGAGAMC